MESDQIGTNPGLRDYDGCLIPGLWDNDGCPSEQITIHIGDDAYDAELHVYGCEHKLGKSGSVVFGRPIWIILQELPKGAIGTKVD